MGHSMVDGEKLFDSCTTSEEMDQIISQELGKQTNGAIGLPTHTSWVSVRV